MQAISAEEYVELAFEAGSGAIAQSADEQRALDALEAARSFDTRHRQVTQVARQSLLKLELRPGDLGELQSYGRRVLEVKRNRFVVPERLEETRAIKGRRRRRKRVPWRLETSCWAPRRESGNSRDFFETTEALRRMFELDWAVAVMALAEKVAVHSAAVMEAAQAAAAALATVLSTRAQQVVAVQALHQPTARPQQ